MITDATFLNKMLPIEFSNLLKKITLCSNEIYFRNRKLVQYLKSIIVIYHINRLMRKNLIIVLMIPKKPAHLAEFNTPYYRNSQITRNKSELPQLDIKHL